MEELALGVTVDRYRLLARLGEGGQGDVWRAEDTLRPGVQLALKLISLPAATSNAADRLRREARLLARLEHPSLPRCHAIFEDPRKDIFGFALDLVDGVALSELQGTPALSVEQRIQILLHVAGALRFVHQAGLVHRDVKASNIVIDDAFFARPSDPSTVKLLDFGIAAEQDNPRRLTAPGSVIGTISHLAPELLDQGFWREKADGPERDLFAFGVLAFEIFRGAHPTGLPPGSSYGDYLAAYRRYATRSAGWPPGVEGDPLEMLYRRCLALRASERATSEEALSLVEQAQVPARAGRKPATAPPVSPTAPTRVFPREPRLPAAAVPDPLRSTPRSWTTDPATPRSSPEVHTTPSRRQDAPAFTTPDVLSSGWPSSTPSPRPRSAGGGRQSPKDVRGAKAVYLLVPFLLVTVFAVSFVVVLLSSRETSPSMSPTSAVSPTPAVLPTSLRLDPIGSDPSLLSSTGPTVSTAPTHFSCPTGMVAIQGSPDFCIDRHEVTASAYARSGLAPAMQASWPGATEPERSKRTLNCAARRGAQEGQPVNCVSWNNAEFYCAARRARLPTLEELRRAAAVIDHCTIPPPICPIFEWTRDRQEGSQTYRKTRGPSFQLDRATGSNPESATNDDLGFRCASDPL